MSISNAAWDAHENAMPYDSDRDCPWCDEPTENFNSNGIAEECDECEERHRDFEEGSDEGDDA